MVEVMGNRTVRLLTSPQPSDYSFDCVAGETFSQDALFKGKLAGRLHSSCAIHLAHHSAASAERAVVNQLSLAQTYPAYNAADELATKSRLSAHDKSSM